MAGETRRKFDKDFREGAARLVRETGKPVAQVARDLGVNEGTLGNWVNAGRRRREGGDGQLSEDERAELVRLRRENAELQMRCDVLKRSVALWVHDAARRQGHRRGRQIGATPAVAFRGDESGVDHAPGRVKNGLPDVSRRETEKALRFFCADVLDPA